MRTGEDRTATAAAPGVTGEASASASQSPGLASAASTTKSAGAAGPAPSTFSSGPGRPFGACSAPRSVGLSGPEVTRTENGRPESTAKNTRSVAPASSAVMPSVVSAGTRHDHGVDEPEERPGERVRAPAGHHTDMHAGGTELGRPIPEVDVRHARVEPDARRAR